jgi:hypothetical protein
MPEKISNNLESRVDIIRTVQTPLGFFVLVVLVVEAILGVVATFGAGFDRTLTIAGMLVLIASLIAIVAFLAYSRPEALAGGRKKSDGDPDGGAQKIRLTFEDLVDIRKLDRQQAVCTFVDSAAIDVLDNEQVTPQIISDEHEGPFIKLKIPTQKDYVYISVDHDGRTYSGSFAVHSRMVTLNED